MFLRNVFSVLLVLAPFGEGANIGRQTGCDEFGTYPEYKGPCETTSKNFWTMRIDALLLR
jgi:hypothetical protein